jgi:cyanate permease
MKKSKIMKSLLLVGLLCVVLGMFVEYFTKASGDLKDFIKGFGWGLTFISALMLWRLRMKQAK